LNKILGILIILIFHLPIIIFGKDSYIIINDNLDVDFLYNHLLKITNNLFNLSVSDTLYLVGENLKLSYIHSPLNFIKLFFLIFDSFDAYLINSIFVRIIGFIFMYFLINDHFNLNNKTSSLLVSISFSLAPIYTIYGLSLMGLPMILWSIINIYNRKHILTSYMLIALFPFYSLIQFSSPFIIFYLVLFLLYDCYNKKKINYDLVYPILIIFGAAIIANFNIISTLFLDNAEKSHRFLIGYEQYPSLKGILYKFFRVITFGDERSLFISIPIIVYIIVYIKRIKRLTAIILTFIIINTFILAVYPILYNELKISELIPFNFSRFTYMNIFLFYLAFLTLINQKKFTYIVLFLSIFLNLIRNQEFIYNILPNSKAEIAHHIFNEDKIIMSVFPDQLINNKVEDFHQKGFYSYNEFYSEDLFDNIESFIGKPKSNYLISTIGINPSVTQFNGFRTINAYLVNYPQSLSNKLNRINNNNSVIRSNDLYIYSSEILSSCNNYCYKNNSPEILKNLDLNFHEMQESNIEYIFSSSKIILNDTNVLTELSCFENKKSPYKVFVYKLNKS